MYALRRPCRPIQASSLLLHHRLLVNAVIARVHMHRSTIGRYRRLTEGFSRWRQLHRRLVCLRIVHTPSLAFSFSFLSLSSQPHCIKDLHPHPKRTICRLIIESEVVSSGLELSCFLQCIPHDGNEALASRGVPLLCKSVQVVSPPLDAIQLEEKPAAFPGLSIAVVLEAVEEPCRHETLDAV